MAALASKRSRARSPSRRRIAGGFLGWLDFHDGDLKAIKALLTGGEDTVDELGLAPLAGVVADALYPATSVLMTEPRYLFFVSTIYRYLEAEKTPSVDVPVARKQLEDRVRDRLEHAYADDAGGRSGIIGRRSRDELKRYPSSIYWRSLGQLGLYTEPGVSERAHVDGLDAFYESAGGVATDDAAHTYAEDSERWNPKLPRVARLIEHLSTASTRGAPLSFQLTRAEAVFLRDAFLHRFPKSLLSHRLIEKADPEGAPWPWSQRAEAVSSSQRDNAARLNRILHHAKRLSALSRGATLQYFDILLEKRAGCRIRDDGDLRGLVAEGFARWNAKSAGLLATWRQANCSIPFLRLAQPASRVGRPTVGFSRLGLSG